MQINNISFPEDIYSLHLETVNDIKFTRREVDIIAYLFSGRSAKTISSFLSIAPKTLESHMRNIMIKLDCNSRDGIIDFIEKSNKFLFIKRYYLSLLVQASFERQLAAIADEVGPNRQACMLVHWEEEEYKPCSIRSLEKHLTQAGFKVFQDSYGGHSWPQDPLLGVKEEKADQVLYLIPQKLHKEAGQEETQAFLKKISEHSKCTAVFFLPPEGETASLGKRKSTRLMNFFECENYYCFVFALLKKLLPEINFEEKIREFRDLCKTVYEPHEVAPQLPGKPVLGGEDSPWVKTLALHGSLFMQQMLHKKKGVFLGALAGLFIFINVFLISGGAGFFSYLKSSGEEGSVRSDLVVPTDSVFLNRPELLQHIEESFKGNQEIQTTALIGIGGAGKTTLARHYARKQSANLVWEFNAETQESLKDSFENLADALCQTEAEKKTFRALKDIKIVKERDQRIISFVRERLKKLSNWFLVYDNVGKISDIQPYFPSDFHVWGKGKVILVTRDNNLKNNSVVNRTVQVAGLSAEEKLALFAKIMTNGIQENFTPVQKEEAKKFLYNIPPFPLDVSIAAYYLKATHIPYEKYLAHLKEQHQDFAIIQENVLKGASHYTKTRYDIITLSLQQLMGVHKEFADLLLFISLLDFRGIPLDLLNKLKNEILVESFIYNLKKYSLITHQISSSAAFPTLSIHQSTQEISLEYLKNILSLNRKNSALQSIFNAFDSYMEKIINEEDLPRLKLSVKHCEALLRHRGLLSPIVSGTIEAKIGYIYYYLNNYKKAKDFLESSLKDFKESGPAAQAKIAQTLMYLGDVYSELCNHQKAKSLCQQSLDLYRKHFSQNELGIARALAYLGNVYRRLGDYTKAKDLCEQSLAIYQKYFSENPVRVSWVLAHLGITYKELGDYKEAKTILERSLKIYEENLSQNHARVAWVCGHLGDVYRELGDYQRAKTLLTRSLAIYISTFSEEHLRVAWIKSLLGNLSRDLGNYKEAKNYFLKSLDVHEKNYDQNHIEIGFLLAMLGKVYLLAGDLGVSEKFFQRALKILQHNNHPKCYFPLEGLADIHMQKYHQADAKGNVQQAQQSKEQSLNYLIQAQRIVEIYFPPEFTARKKILLKLKEL